ncbi:uncharacterized protein JCM6883_005421 [Sporobolomyces salmoneus]|uniref:uncharacterized protein n=1 Tax=Sporobolomyces salmoneus TaxID=183962 RepID=UPI003175E05B
MDPVNYNAYFEGQPYRGNTMHHLSNQAQSQTYSNQPQSNGAQYRYHPNLSTSSLPSSTLYLHRGGSSEDSYPFSSQPPVHSNLLPPRLSSPFPRSGSVTPRPLDHSSQIVSFDPLQTYSPNHGLTLSALSSPHAPSPSYDSYFENPTSSSQYLGFDDKERTTPTPIPPPSLLVNDAPLHLEEAHNPFKAISRRTSKVTSTSLPHLSTKASQAEAGEFKKHIDRLTKSRANHKRNETRPSYSTEYRKFSKQISRALAEYSAWLKANGKTDDSLLEPNVKRQKRSRDGEAMI